MTAGWRCKLCPRPAMEGSTFCREHAGVREPKARRRNEYAGKYEPRGPRFGPTATAEWHEFSRRFLRQNPWCARCRASDRWVRSTDTDHVIPARKLHERSPALIYDPAWLQALCKKCHGTKSLHERSGRCYDYRQTPIKCYMVKK